ncbi:type VI secretion system effector, Hcp1 family [Pedosphaera parvula Ellin514]|uniref:Type VI secretion system effector, Hcp1 family n=2 Tax=Pedosphaera TaxID=1032526 RepID=B9XSZ0_PEDPL|nr:type VI secretion system effector, Hcp1 family [Pedosphaera parvula Ellin514]
MGKVIIEMKARFALFAVLLTAVAFATTSAHAAYNIYLQAGAIQGESTSTTHPKWCDVYSISYGVSNPFDFTSSPPTEKPNISSINLMKSMDKASPIFIQDCNIGTHLSTVVIEFEKAGTSVPVVFYRITLEDAVITSIQHSGSAGGDDTLTESVSINFARIKWTYYPVDAKGTVGTKVETGWDVQNNKAY